MQSHLILLGFLAAMVAAAPSANPDIKKRGVFKVERVRNANFQGHNGPRQLLKSLRKYRMNIPPALMDAINAQTPAPTQDKLTNSLAVGDKAANVSAAANTTTAAAAPGTGLVAATPEQGDVEYLAPVNIGGQTLNLDFDSGSSDLWVFSNQLPAASQTGHTLYDATKSTSLKMLAGSTFSISYGDGSGAAGVVGTDTVNIGGATVTAQAIEMATAVSTSFVQDTQNNGLVGLAYSKLNTVKPAQQKTFFDNAMPSLAMPVFTADLRKNAVGSYEFGNIDATKFNGTMTWVNVNTTQGFWQFASTKFAVGTGAAQPSNPVGQAIADTGTTLIIADPSVVQGYYSQVPSAQNNAQVGGVTVDCNAQLPDLMLDVGGTYMAKVRGEDINFAQVQGNSKCFLDESCPKTQATHC